MQSYAEPLLDILDPERRYFSHRLYRDSCLRVPSQSRPGMAFLMKDLTSLGRPLESLMIIDNTPTVSFSYRQCLNLETLIPVREPGKSQPKTCSERESHSVGLSCHILKAYSVLAAASFSKVRLGTPEKLRCRL